MLAFLRGEPGADVVERTLEDGATVGAANWSEVAQKVHQHERSWDTARALLLSYEPRIVPVTAEDAEWAANRWTAGEGLSLGDRLCLAVAARLGASVLTCDTTWGSSDTIRQIR